MLSARKTKCNLRRSPITFGASLWSFSLAFPRPLELVDRPLSTYEFLLLGRWSIPHPLFSLSCPLAKPLNSKQVNAFSDALRIASLTLPVPNPSLESSLGIKIVLARRNGRFMSQKRLHPILYNICPANNPFFQNQRKECYSISNFCLPYFIARSTNPKPHHEGCFYLYCTRLL